MGKGRRIAGAAVLSLLWALIVCYPDPRLLWQAIVHTRTPPLDPAAVRAWAESLPDDPAAIERAVAARVRYAVPWQQFGVPWAVPTPADVVASGFGDCQARALVLASLLAAKGIPFQLRASLDHMWVEYRGKRATALENDAKLLWTRGQATTDLGGLADSGSNGLQIGPMRFHLPHLDWTESYRIEKAYFWDAAPLSRKLALAAGLVAIWCLTLTWRMRRAGVPRTLPTPPAPHPAWAA
jgi:hypothetical protein